MKDYMSIPEFYREFPDEQVCKDFIVQERWNGNPICPHCGHDKVYEIRDGMGYKCAECKERFSVRTGSLLENSRLPLQTLVACHLHHDNRAQGDLQRPVCKGTGHHSKDGLVLG